MNDIKYNQVRNHLADYRKTIIAYSGGADSSLVLKLSADILGTENVIAVTGSSETYTREEIEFAKFFAAQCGVRHIIIHTCELQDDKFCSNPPERCYICKYHFYSEVESLRLKENFEHILDGSNADDMQDFRPGLKAARGFGVKSPFAECGLTKNDIQKISREIGLVTWDRPANPCLASRIPYGSRITGEKLRMVADAERYIRSLGFCVVRVRHHDLMAKIEVPEDDLSRLLSDETRNLISMKLKEIGFKWISADIEGYRQGSLNNALNFKKADKTV